MLKRGFTLLELLLVISLLSILFLFIPGLNLTSRFRIANQDEVQRLVDNLRLAQRRAILEGVNQYLTIDPEHIGYQIYQLSGSELLIYHQIILENFQSISINRSVSGLNNTFYFTPAGTSVFGCTITLEDNFNLWRVIVAVGSGKIRIEKE